MVEVDCHTGDSSVLSADLVVDIGKSVNPGIDVGQIEGAFVQGQGYVTNEQILLSPTSGEMLTNGPGSYKVHLLAKLQTTSYGYCTKSLLLFARFRRQLTSQRSSMSLF